MHWTLMLNVMFFYCMCLSFDYTFIFPLTTYQDIQRKSVNVGEKSVSDISMYIDQNVTLGDQGRAPPCKQEQRNDNGKNIFSLLRQFAFFQKGEYLINDII